MARFTSYSSKAKPTDSDTLLINDASSSSNKQVSFAAVLAWLKDKLGSSTIDGLDTTSKNVVGAINEINTTVGNKADSSSVYTKSQVDALIESVDVETDTTLSVSGKPADAKKTGDEINALRADLEDLDERIDNIDVSLSDTAIQLLETILNAAVYTTDQSANIDALIEELSSDSNVDSITVADGVMTILGLANTPTLSNGILSIT